MVLAIKIVRIFNNEFLISYNHNVLFLLESCVFSQKIKTPHKRCLSLQTKKHPYRVPLFWLGRRMFQLENTSCSFLRRFLLDNIVKRSPYKQSTGLFVPHCARHGRLRIPPGKIKPLIQGAFILAGPAGFEPTRDGVKVRCLTAWRRPIIKLKAAQDFPVRLW